jgi:predicted membrane protein
MNNNKSIFWAFTLIALGLIFLAKNFGLIFFNWPKHFSFWAIFPLIFGINALFDGKRTEGIIGVLLGLIFILPPLLGLGDWLSFKKLWPLILMAVGTMIFFNRTNTRHPLYFPKPDEQSSGNSFSKSVIMGGIQSKVSSKEFSNGQITAIMGGVELDMRDADLAENAYFDINCIMGGVEILAPKEWNIVLSHTPIMGGVSDNISKYPSDVVDATKTIYLRGLVVMGGVDIKRI